MKKVYLLFIALLVLIVLQLSSALGPLPENTGAPGEFTCGRAPCHNIPANIGSARIAIDVSGESDVYQADSIYEVSVSVTNAPTNKNGFQILALNAANQNVGTWQLALPQHTQQISGIGLPNRKYVTHTALGNQLTTWKVNWKAPAANRGDVTFYASVLTANNNGENTGDSLYTTTHRLSFVNPVLEEEDERIIIGHPNPIGDSIRLRLPNDLVCDGALFHGNGQPLANYPTLKNDADIDTRDLPPGVYFLQLTVAGKLLKTLVFLKN